MFIIKTVSTIKVSFKSILRLKFVKTYFQIFHPTLPVTDLSQEAHSTHFKPGFKQVLTGIYQGELYAIKHNWSSR